MGRNRTPTPQWAPQDVPRLWATFDLFRLDVTDVGVDGVLWWGYADDEPDEEDGGACDRGELRADALILHVLTRIRPSERVDFLSPWRSSTLADAARVVVPLTRDLKVTQADDIEPVITVLQTRHSSRKKPAPVESGRHPEEQVRVCEAWLAGTARNDVGVRAGRMTGVDGCGARCSGWFEFWSITGLLTGL
ncbi:hypothetical protein GIY30_16675 [Gordonia sp. HNM0687]|uniref:Uncharacterized protein n=1 Tax=Gordonia mangrovi TaxID=2665643 RepID=A0A6L7GTT5_9ACTN|nr:hypothetical protein [Gordonia mangrovi]MXP22973.1 hypothetical protein [Gordonia mangrovi]UVF77269.1 hypothetical protein NWF22_18490 [Gordonia mangrovi]